MRILSAGGSGWMYPCSDLYRTLLPRKCPDITGEEPLVLEALHDPEVDLCGRCIRRKPRRSTLRNSMYPKRVGHTVEMMDVDGAFVTTEGFGNNHIDFASHIEQIGMRGVPVVGMVLLCSTGRAGCW